MSGDTSTESQDKSLENILAVCEPGILPLVKSVRELGWETISSCEGHGICESAKVDVLLSTRKQADRFRVLGIIPGVFVEVIDSRIFGDLDTFYNLASSYMTAEDYYVMEIRIGYNISIFKCPALARYQACYNKFAKPRVVKLIAGLLAKHVGSFV